MMNKVKNRCYIEYIILSLFICAQVLVSLYAQYHTRISGDGIFTYTLSNNPYDYTFIDDIYEIFPENNGWILGGATGKLCSRRLRQI